MDYWSNIRSPEDLGFTVQQARISAGLNQRQLAKATGIAQSAISDVESGKHTIYAERIFTLLDALNVTIKAEWSGDAPQR
ncbi:helix-turn-helix domain-containing protein [Haematomicrobium sanguinis]|uniref:helix-turn-helix domain-containing protein n=1 Tax=Haematomicrobium sanguinis TaxID=479106 RepID=UPI00054FC558|nr:helix-turn-helix transcriptional regulator [Haematomicrobium sanguinis]